MLKSVSNVVHFAAASSLLRVSSNRPNRSFASGDAADRERQHHDRRVHALGQPVRGLRIVVGIEQDQLRGGVAVSLPTSVPR